MIIAIQFIIALLICTVIPVLIGDLLLPNEPLGKQFIMGFLGSLAIAQVVFLPFIIFQHHFTPYYIVFSVIIVGICILSIIKRHGHYNNRLKHLMNIGDTIGGFNLWMICAVLLIGFQVVRVTIGHFFVYADNARYIPIINDLIETDLDYYLDYIKGIPGAKETDIKYLFTAYFPYLASICKISGLHPAILVQTLLPIILTLSLYDTVWHCGLLLFKEKKSSWMFVFFFGVLVETIGGYDYTYANHAISGIYFGKKVVFTILLPFIMLFIAERTSLLEKQVRNLKTSEVLLLLIMMIGVCAPSLMGTGLAPIVLFSLGLVLTIRSKTFKPLIQMGIAMMPSVVFLLMVVIHLYFR